MSASGIGARYAKALYQLAAEQNQQDQTFDQIRALATAINEDKSIADFLSSPLVRPAQKESAFEATFKTVHASELVQKFVYLLARKQRLEIFGQVVAAYQELADTKHGLVRGIVRSTTVLSPDERKRIEDTVNRVTAKQSLLTYKEDPQLLGGLVAEVGSFTFDDSLSAHLRRMNEQLNRRSV